MSRIRDLASILTASSVLGTDVEVSTAVSDHSAASDPHTGYVLESLIDAKGDLIVGSADNTVAKLSTGNSGESIVADSSTATGLRYQSAYNGNGIINGGMDIWQRGTSFALTTPQLAYTADRWMARHLGTNVTYSQQASGLAGIQYGLRVQRPVSTTGVNEQQIYYQFETADSYRFAGQTFTLSFWAKAGANFSATSSILNSSVYTGTGVNQNVGNGAYTGFASVANQNNTLTTSYQRFSVTGTIGSTATQIAIILSSTPTGTAGANDWYEITGVQLEYGSVATSFKRSAGGSIQGELAACQRYLPAISAAGNDIVTGQAYSTTQVLVPIVFPVTPRVKPTGLTVSSVASFYVRANNAGFLACTAVTFENGGPTSGTLVAAVASGLTAGNASNFFGNSPGLILFTGCEL